ncbi:hypothetical protein B7R74_12460 [Yersinia pseudotuberculosis]|uniref:Arc family DNA-binding protein n=1 Tax=Yersinia pseudotuberculosis TaxID=633 RepID=UPI0005DD66E0|nr:Arc family DNA-binding protein [Yersinia pseudotuberculosis]AXY33951.1 Arc family DNA-binding protein [Yersinia pseudotuberculosis]AYX09625.1 Arc family DNA-binding protein [Yersinia pseudotuberculosis]PEI13530.1 Arc family DNA-binding protein [Yersinia pseudotuberculosis]PSH19824.1 hypothetical protein B7R74_12460 [Yersinia pseudotuberculosis]CND56555.1 putative phage regulatory protein [Yersinia pseudotuberculosis]
MSREDPQLRVRIPECLKDELERCAHENKRTLTAEVVDRLEATVDQDFYWAANSVGYKLFPQEYENLQKEYVELKVKADFIPSFESFNEHEQDLREAIATLKKFFDGELK